MSLEGKGHRVPPGATRTIRRAEPTRLGDDDESPASGGALVFREGHPRGRAYLR